VIWPQQIGVKPPSSRGDLRDAVSGARDRRDGRADARDPDRVRLRRARPRGLGGGTAVA
jgi:hypothetical protein